MVGSIRLANIVASLALTHNESVVIADKEHFEKVSGLIVESR
jgi:predicted nucleic acid-binding protein